MHCLPLLSNPPLHRNWVCQQDIVVQWSESKQARQVYTYRHPVCVHLCHIKVVHRISGPSHVWCNFYPVNVFRHYILHSIWVLIQDQLDQCCKVIFCNLSFSCILLLIFCENSVPCFHRNAGIGIISSNVASQLSPSHWPWPMTFNPGQDQRVFFFREVSTRW